MGNCPSHIPVPSKSALQLPPPVLVQPDVLWKASCTMQRKHEQPLVLLSGVRLRARMQLSLVEKDTPWSVPALQDVLKAQRGSVICSR